MAHHRPDVAHVDLPDGEIALPADHIERIERIEHFRDLVVGLDANLPFAIVVEDAASGSGVVTTAGSYSACWPSSPFSGGSNSVRDWMIRKKLSSVSGTMR